MFFPFFPYLHTYKRLRFSIVLHGDTAEVIAVLGSTPSPDLDLQIGIEDGNAPELPLIACGGLSALHIA